MLIIVREMADMYIKINRLVVRRLVRETETMKTTPLNQKFKLFTGLVTRIMDLITMWTFYLAKTCNYRRCVMMLLQKNILYHNITEIIGIIMNPQFLLPYLQVGNRDNSTVRQQHGIIPRQVRLAGKLWNVSIGHTKIQKHTKQWKCIKECVVEYYTLKSTQFSYNLFPLFFFYLTSYSMTLTRFPYQTSIKVEDNFAVWIFFPLHPPKNEVDKEYNKRK